MKRTLSGLLAASLLLVAVILGSTVIKAWPKEYFWVDRQGARIPVWVRGNTASRVFVVFVHGGPGSSGTLESILEVSPADGRFDHPSPLQFLESDFSVVYWDQRHSGMSRGPADPDESLPEDFGEDLALVVRELRRRHHVEHLFLIGQSWGHAVAMSYLTHVASWRENQAGIAGYIGYKGNHEQDLAYQAARPRIVRHAEERIATGIDVPTWGEALEFYRATPALVTLRDAGRHDEYVGRAMGVSTSLLERIWSAFRASVFSPFNGWAYYLNHRRTVRAERFMLRVVTSSDLRDTVPRLAIPTLLVYGEKDLVAPPEVGQAILDAIATPAPQKSLLMLPHSRHGAEGEDVAVMQRAIRDFVRRTAAATRATR